MTTERMGILGCGLMGAGIAEVVSCAGYDVRVLEQNRAALDAGNARINRLIDRAVDTGGISPELRALSLGRISYSTEVEELGDRDLIIEAVVEDLEIKNQLFRELDGFCGDQTIFASNTSSLTITEMAAAVDRADRMVGLHFFNPVRAMDLVEIVRTISTSDETLDKVTAFVRILGKESVTIRDSSGFLVNRLLVPFILDAIRLGRDRRCLYRRDRQSDGARVRASDGATQAMRFRGERYGSPGRRRSCMRSIGRSDTRPRPCLSDWW